jgi:hypothetical protein
MANEPEPPRPEAEGSEPSQGSEQHAAPPFLSWRAIYLIVIGALAVEIALGAIATAVLG